MTTTTFDTTPHRGSPVVRWLAAMLEQARVREANNPEFAEHIAA